MVTKTPIREAMFPKTMFLLTLCGSIFLLSGCSLDLSGFFVSSDVESRLASKNIFHFLTDSDRNLSLGASYSFVTLSDTHIEGGDAHGLEKLKDHIAPSDKFVAVTGDITQNGSREDLEKFIEIAETLGIPCYPVIGNHDVFFGNFSNWRDLIGSTSYRIDHSNTTLFILDSANSSFGASQIDWLRKELESPRNHVFVFTHVNLFVGSPLNAAHAGQLSEIRERAKVMSILKGRVDAVFMGHIHMRLIREAGGVKYIVTEDFKDHRTYCRVYVSEAGIRYEFLSL
jgi:3',5'-cyclic AMP phosphodiesterase CpdA